LTDAVIAAQQAIERAGNRAYKAFGLSQRAHAVMQAVDLGGPDGARPSDVASELGVSRAAATTFIQRLEAKGFVETTTDPDDDRGVRVCITRPGLEVLLRVGQLEWRRAARTIEGMPASATVRTLGPASGNVPTVAGLLRAGANGLRINAWAGTPELRAECIDAARRVAAGIDSPVAVLLVLQGPRIRVGHLPAPRELKPGQEV